MEDDKDEDRQRWACERMHCSSVDNKRDEERDSSEQDRTGKSQEGMIVQETLCR